MAQDNSYWDYGDYEYTDYASTDAVVLQGDGNTLPLVSDTTPARDSSLLDLLGSIGSTARDLGTAAGKIVKDVKGAKTEFQTGYDNAKAGNSLGTWWQYASITDKLMVGLGVAGIAVVLLKK